MEASVTSRLLSSLAELSLANTLLVALSVLLVSFVTPTLYNAFVGPLAKFPGPKLRALSGLPQSISIFSGREHEDYAAMHRKYGKVVRVAPNELSFAGSATVFKDVLGFKKAGTTNFPKCRRFYGGQLLDEPNTFLANADDIVHSKLRRAMSHAFADKSLHDVEHRLLNWVGNFRRRLDGVQGKPEAIDMVKLFNCGTFG
jgi:cytochrome P450